MSYKNWPAARVQQLRELWIAGHTVREIKAAMRISGPTVLAARRFYGLLPRHHGNTRYQSRVKPDPSKRAAVLPCPDLPGWPNLQQLMGRR